MLLFGYTSLFFYSLLCFCILVFRFKNRISVYYVLLFLSMIQINFGYMQLACARNELMAIFSNQTVYLGASFCPFFMIMCLCDLCRIDVRLYVRNMLLFVGCLLFIFVSTTGVYPWYYKSVELVHRFGISMLRKNYGPLHTLYPLYLVGTNIAGFFIIFSAFKRRRDVSYITSTMLLIANCISVSSYIIEKILDVPMIPLGNFVSQTMLLILIARISEYDVASISSAYLADSKTTGFFLCDSQGLFLGSDETAKEWFTELSELKIDLPIRNESSDLLVQIKKWLNKTELKDQVLLQRNDKIFEIKHYLLKEKKRKSVHCFSIRDDTKQQQYTKLVEEQVEQKTERLKQVQDDIIISMASIVENRDNNTGGHIARTSDVVKIFVNHLMESNYYGLTKEISHCIVKAAPLHDFGKIGVPDVVLNKPGKFTEEEYEIMKTHSAKGAVIVERILQNSDDEQFKRIAVNVAHYHHEKWNGQGYPEKIKETEIPFEARIMALADVFDALISKRVYKDSFDYNKAFSIIEESSGSHFDPELCTEFLKCRSKLEELYDSYTD